MSEHLLQVLRLLVTLLPESQVPFTLAVETPGLRPWGLTSKGHRWLRRMIVAKLTELTGNLYLIVPSHIDPDTIEICP